MLIEYQNLGIRELREDDEDFAYMARWLSDARVLEFYHGRDQPMSMEAVRAKFAPGTLAEDGVTPCMMTMGGTPVGYAQYYLLDTDTFGTDQFIGEPALWNYGLGTWMVSLLLRYLFETKHAQRVIVDPQTRNARAIRCYEKCGFRKVRLMARHELHEGEYRDCWLMEATAESAGL